MEERRREHFSDRVGSEGLGEEEDVWREEEGHREQEITRVSEVKQVREVVYRIRRVVCRISENNRVRKVNEIIQNNEAIHQVNGTILVRKTIQHLKEASLLALRNEVILRMRLLVLLILSEVDNEMDNETLLRGITKPLLSLFVSAITLLILVSVINMLILASTIDLLILHQIFS